MKKQLTDEQLRDKIKKCPLWIQDVTNAALRERDNAKAELASHYSEQKATPFYEEHFDVNGTTKQYFNARGMVVEHAGIKLEIRLNANNTRDGNGIELRYSRPDDSTAFDQIALIPKITNTIELRAVEHMRQPFKAGKA